MRRSAILVAVTALALTIIAPRASAAVSKSVPLKPDNTWPFPKGRGGAHVVDADLLAALDSGRLSGAVLDVFRLEPLPAEHPFWRHPKVTLTPHVASMSDPRTVIEQVIENVRRTDRGEAPLNRVDPEQQY